MGGLAPMILEAEKSNGRLSACLETLKWRQRGSGQGQRPRNWGSWWCNSQCKAEGRRTWGAAGVHPGVQRPGGQSSMSKDRRRRKSQLQEGEEFNCPLPFLSFPGSWGGLREVRGATTLRADLPCWVHPDSHGKLLQKQPPRHADGTLYQFSRSPSIQVRWHPESSFTSTFVEISGPHRHGLPWSLSCCVVCACPCAHTLLSGCHSFTACPKSEPGSPQPSAFHVPVALASPPFAFSHGFWNCLSFGPPWLPSGALQGPPGVSWLCLTFPQRGVLFQNFCWFLFISLYERELSFSIDLLGFINH